MNPFKYLIMIPFGWILLQLYKVVNNYGVALILFSILIKLILLPLSMKSKKSMMKISRLSPRMKALEEKCNGNQQLYQQEVQKLYKEEGVSMGGGCLWSVIPMLILIPLYYVIRQPLTYIMGLDEGMVSQIVSVLTNHGIEIDTSNYYYQMTAAGYIGQFFEEISAAVPKAVNMDFNFLGIDLCSKPVLKFWTNGYTWANIGLFLLPWISGAANWLSSWLMQKLNNTVATDDKGQKDEKAASMANQTTKSMMIFMPLMSVYIGFVVPAGMCIYWIVQAIFGIFQEFFLTNHYRKVYDEEDAIKAQRAAEQAAADAEKEQRRAERRAQMGTDTVDPNTNKKKAKAILEGQRQAEREAYATAKAAEKAAAQGLSAETAVLPDSDKPEILDAARPNARGRAYRSDRYPNPQSSYVPTPVAAEETLAETTGSSASENPVQADATGETESET